MNWLILSLLAPLLWASVNHIDKYLLSKYFKSGGAGALIIFSTLVGFIVAPIIAIFNPDIFSISNSDLLILVAVGIFNAFATLLYFYALETEEASYIVPIFQTIPIFGFILGYLMLNEIPTLPQLIGSILIIIGAFALSLDFQTYSKVRLRAKALILMLGSSLLFAFYNTLFKFATVQESFWISVFWEYVGLAVVSIVLLIFVTTYRKQFVYLMRNNKLPVLSLNLTNEGLTMLGNLASGFASLLVPIGLVFAVTSTQPIFVLIIGVFLAFFIPSGQSEKMDRFSVLQKSVSILLVVVGSVYLYISF